MTHPNLKGWWRFENDLLDSSGNGNDGAMGAGSATYAAGVQGQAYDSSTARFVTIADSASMRITGALTVAAWVRRTASLANHSGLLDKWYRAAAVRSWNFIVLSSAGSHLPRFSISQNGAAGVLVDGPTTPANGWMHIVGTYTPSSALRIYIDGALYATNTTGIYSSLYNATTAVYIGQYSDNSGYRFTGQIEDARIYNCALDANDIRRVYLGMQPTRIY